MKIGIDIQAIQTKGSRNRGIGRYTYSVIEALLNLSNEHKYKLYSNKNLLPPETNDFLPNYNYFNFLDNGSESFNNYLARDTLISEDIDALLIASPVEGNDVILPNYIKKSKSLFTICYDIIPLLFKEKYLDTPDKLSFYMRRMANYKNSDFIFAISEATRQDAIKHLGISPDRIINVSGGVSPFFNPISVNEHRVWLNNFSNKFRINKKFILYTGGEDWRKNIQGLIEGFAQLPKDLQQEYQLVVACKVSENFINHIKALAKKLGIAQSIILTNYVSDEELRALYSTCNLFVFPSFYEGFGLPLLEAISCGAPAIASNSSSLVEIVSDPDLLFDPHSTEDIAQCIHKVLTNESLRKKLSENALSHASQFTWESVAKKISDVFTDFQSGKKKSISCKPIKDQSYRNKIAFFSPFPPLKSGIADYSQNLLPFLSNHLDLDLYHDKGYSPEANLDSNYQIFPHHKFEEKARVENYETVIYQIGNSDHHCYIYQQLMQYPGISVLHDYYLAGMIKYMDHHPEFSVTFSQELIHNYGINKSTEILSKLDTEELNNNEKLAQAKIYLNRRIFTSSLGVIVNSKSTYNTAIKDFGRDNEFITHIPLLATPFHFDENPIDIRQQLNIPANAFVISTFGIIFHTKRALPIIDAFHKYLYNHPNAYLLFVGSSEIMKELYGDLLENEISKLGLDGKVKITGYVTMADFYRYIQISDLCLNLRFPSNGESSTSLLRILSAGKPTIVTDIGSFSDFPSDVVFKIPQPTQCDEVEEICKALTLLTDNQDYRNSLGSKATAYVAREHSPERCARLYMEFIQHVCNSPEAKSKLVARCNQVNTINLSSAQGNGHGGIARQQYLQLEAKKQWAENREQAWRNTAKTVQLDLELLKDFLKNK